MTILPRASISPAPPAWMFGLTSRILLPSTSTSALTKSPTFGSIDRTWPPRMTYLRPGRPLSCGGSPASCALAGRALNRLAPAAAATLAVEAFRKSRRPSCEREWFCGLPLSHRVHIVVSASRSSTYYGKNKNRDRPHFSCFFSERTPHRRCDGLAHAV